MTDNSKWSHQFSDRSLNSTNSTYPLLTTYFEPLEYRPV